MVLRGFVSDMNPLQQPTAGRAHPTTAPRRGFEHLHHNVHQKLARTTTGTVRSSDTLAAAAAGIVLGRHQTVYVDGSTQNIGRGLYLHPLTKGTVALSPLRTIVVPGFEVEGLGFRI
jgi:hypothetical protein